MQPRSPPPGESQEARRTLWTTRRPYGFRFKNIAKSVRNFSKRNINHIGCHMDRVLVVCNPLEGPARNAGPASRVQTYRKCTGRCNRAVARAKPSRRGKFLYALPLPIPVCISTAVATAVAPPTSVVAIAHPSRVEPKKIFRGSQGLGEAPKA